MDVGAVLEAVGGSEPGDGKVLLRLLLVAADQVTGEQTFVGSFVKQISMPHALVGPEVKLALEILGERRVLKPTTVLWDEAYRVCILEIEWVVADHTSVGETSETEPWMVS